MRKLGLAVALVALLAVGVLALLGSGSTAGAANTLAGQVNYVALGDSYSSGVGAGGNIGASGACERSANAYPQLWATEHAPTSYVSVACSGAKTTDVSAGQLSALSPRTTLVSITIGGNDVNFAGVMSDCVLDRTSTCVADLGAAETQARTELPGRLDTVYADIAHHAPNARVVVLGYPRFYDLGKWWCLGLSSTDRSKINEAANVLDDVIATAAGAHANFVYEDVRTAFASGHEICDGSSWLHSVDWKHLSQSYHPTAGGQSGGYLPAFTAGAA